LYGIVDQFCALLPPEEGPPAAASSSSCCSSSSLALPSLEVSHPNGLFGSPIEKSAISLYESLLGEEVIKVSRGLKSAFVSGRAPVLGSRGESCRFRAGEVVVVVVALVVVVVAVADVGFEGDDGSSAFRLDAEVILKFRRSLVFE